MAGAALSIARTFRLEPDVSKALDDIAEIRFGNNKTEAIQAAIQIAAIVYGTTSGRGGIDPADALERYSAARRAKPSDD
jgi:hypothetical protein